MYGKGCILLIDIVLGTVTYPVKLYLTSTLIIGCIREGHTFSAYRQGRQRRSCGSFTKSPITDMSIVKGTEMVLIFVPHIFHNQIDLISNSFDMTGRLCTHEHLLGLLYLLQICAAEPAQILPCLNDDPRSA